MEPILEIAALKKYYGKEPNLTRALDGISFQVMPGEFLGIMGSSGSGKSTLLNCIATVIAPSSGAVALHDKCITTLHGKALADYRGKEIGYLFQNFELIDNLTGRENILLPLALHGVSEGESRERLAKLADYLEVTDVLDKFPAQMSGGQKQRIAAARACDLPYVFEKGFTGDSGHEKNKATGMGLYLAREVAKDLGLTLTAASDWGAGFEIRVTFPVVEE